MDNNKDYQSIRHSDDQPDQQNQQIQEEQHQRQSCSNKNATTTVVTSIKTQSPQRLQQNQSSQQPQQKQKRLGPAPIASFEDTSDDKIKIDGNSPENRLPDISENDLVSSSIQATSLVSSSSLVSFEQPNISMSSNTSTTGVSGVINAGASVSSSGGGGVSGTGIGSGTVNLAVHTPSTPRIDISRASSSSHHEDSRDSSPENVFDQVGTGTLQENNTIKSGLGFEEDGTMDLRSSTEELYFMDPQENDHRTTAETVERDKFTQQVSRSPIMFKFDEHQACLQQNQRKDSASSEVAALLCISGRTSRISSVGSQGSAVSRLSAVSGISRSPSPHKMLLETSFCGPKPVDNDNKLNEYTKISSSATLEQILLARKHDPTHAILAEGIQIIESDNEQNKCAKRIPDLPVPDTNLSQSHGRQSNGNVATSTMITSANITSTPKSVIGERKIISSTATAAMSSTRTSGGGGGGGISSRGGKKSVSQTKPVVGVTSGGIEYIRIKLKPDHMYSDKGLAPNERISEDSGGSVIKKPPATLSLTHTTPKNSTTQLAQSDDSIAKHPIQPQQQRLNANSASPKPARHIAALRDTEVTTGSRSPSPITINISRKNSLCSLFKSNKDLTTTTASSSDSVLGVHRKKSGSSLIQDGSIIGGSSSGDIGGNRSRDRSRSKSRESDRGGCNSSPNSTGSKQKSVLAIFKPKRSGSASKSKPASPIDPEAMSSLDGIQFAGTISALDSANQQQPHPQPPRPKSRLRYYDSPLDGKSIHIPLHTPPDEKDNELCTVEVIKERRQQNEVQSNGGFSKENTLKLQNRSLQQQSINAITQMPITSMTPSANNNRSTITTNTRIIPSKKPTIIQNPDGSIRIPLKSPTTEYAVELPRATNGNDGDNNFSGQAAEDMWSIEANRTSSLESQETIMSVQATVAATPNQIGNDNKTSLVKSNSKNQLRDSSLPRQQQQQQQQPLLPLPMKMPPSKSTSSETLAKLSTIKLSNNSESSSKTYPTTVTSTYTIPNLNTITTSAPTTTMPIVAATTAIVTTTTTATTKEKKRILFATKLGSGSEEQLFATQLSLSKTESLCSQLSEQASLQLDSPGTIIPPVVSNIGNIPLSSLYTSGDGITDSGSVTGDLQYSSMRKFDDAPISVTMRNKDAFEEAMKKTKSKIVQDLVENDEQLPTPINPSDSKIRSTNTNPPSVNNNKKSVNNIRHSRYIENIDEIMEKQRQMEKTGRPYSTTSTEDTQSYDRPIVTSTIKKQRKPEPVFQIPGPPIDEPESELLRQQSSTVTSSITSSKIVTQTQKQPLVTGTGKSVTVIANKKETIERIGSSESERADDSEIDPNSMQRHLPQKIGNVEEESTGLMAQESFDDELPYIPTTLPEEQPILVSLIPVKERALMDVKTCPVERPRSTTPLLNPSCLEAYCESNIIDTISTDGIGDAPFGRGEKLRISLPRKTSKDRGGSSVGVGGIGSGGSGGSGNQTTASKSPRRPSNSSGKSWFEFAEHGVGGGTPTSTGFSANSGGGNSGGSSNSGVAFGFNTSSAFDSPSKFSQFSLDEDSPPPPLPPRKPQNVSQWINFDNIPEKRKPPKRITTLPNKESSTSQAYNDRYDSSSSSGGAKQQIINYVNPEECQCECHENERDSSASGSGGGSKIQLPATIKGTEQNIEQQKSDDTVPLLFESDNTGTIAGGGGDSGVGESDRFLVSSSSTEFDADLQEEHVSRSKTRLRNDKFR